MKLAILPLGARDDHGKSRHGLWQPSSFSGAMLGWISQLQAAWLLTFWSLVLRARLRLGEWPEPQHFDAQVRSYLPSTLDPKAFPLHDLVVWGGLVALMMLLPIVFSLLVAGIFIPSRRPSRRQCLALLMSTALVGITLFAPHGFMLWFVD